MKGPRPLLLCALLAALSPPLPAAAQAPDPQRAPVSSVPSASGVLSLDEVVRSVDLRFPLIIAAQADRTAAEAEQLTAEGGFDPGWRTSAAVIPIGGYPSQRLDTSVEQPLPFWGSSVFAGYRIGRGEFPVYDGKLATNQFGEVRAGARVSILRDGSIDRRRAGIQRAEIGTTVAGLGVEQQKIDATRLASFRYWDWVAAGRRLAIARAWLDLAQQRDAALAKRVEVGDVPAFERQENERAILQRRAGAISAERALEQAAIELSIFLRAADGSPILPPASRLPSSLPEPTPLDRARLAADERTALERRPEPRRVEAQKEQAEVERRWAKNQRLPAIDLVVVGSQDLGPGDPKLAKPVLEAAVVVDIPILNRVAKGRERAASAQVGKLDAQARITRDRILADVRDAASALGAAEGRALLARSETEVARRLAEQESKRFELGEGTLLLVNLREQAALEAALRHIDAAADWQKALAAYKAATAGAGAAVR
ncbi:TolC family protein [Polyangium aurulentum]|uniref:TolC family protein n=1 Tax=Polyangium aurulentum TaxID=2567896 RepID=UPI00146AA3AC|nr:TolC family protein [Polyangium aurulentum]UQA57769.1 TolC family protein [Polyangium aurulentum]